jgi:hypothetical protein
LINDLEPTMERILDFIEIKPTEAFVEEVREQAERQRSYTSPHGHSPSQFGLTPDRIRADLGFVYEAFGLSDRTS